MACGSKTWRRCWGARCRTVADLLALAEAPRSLDAGSERGDDSFTLADTVASDDEGGDPTGVTQTHEVEQLLDQLDPGAERARARGARRPLTACTTAIPRRSRC